MDTQYSDLSFRTSRLVTRRYSTSFSIGVRCLGARVRPAVYAVYGFTRLADEIVDTFHGFDRERLLSELAEEYRQSLARGISLNPIINSFRQTVTDYSIPGELVDAFLSSMRKDLYGCRYDEDELERYIFGSAEAVGLMCLGIFVRGNRPAYDELAPYARRLGAAFQKVNFLRDLGHDVECLHRIYFPVLNEKPFCEETKNVILDDIYRDYTAAEKGIRKLPKEARTGVYAAYLYYRALADRLRRTPADTIASERVRVSDAKKLVLFGKALLTTAVAVPPGAYEHSKGRQATDTV